MTTIGFPAVRPAKSNTLLAEALSSLRAARLVATTRRDRLDISDEIKHLADDVTTSVVVGWRAPAATALASAVVACAVVTTGVAQAFLIIAAIVVTLYALGAIHRRLEYNSVRYQVRHLIDEIVADALVVVDLSDDDQVRIEVQRGLRTLAMAPSPAASLEAASRVEQAVA